MGGGGVGTGGGTTTIEYQKTGAEIQVRVLPRRIIKWLQSLKLSHPIGRYPKRELGNGYAIVEILARHGFREKEENVRIASFENDLSLERKLVNWERIQKMLAQRDMSLPDKLVKSTIHAKSGAAEHLLQLLYSMLTGTSLDPKLPEDPVFDDAEYQASLPAHARSTASKVVSSNLRSSELRTDLDELHMTQNIQNMIAVHKERSTMDRELNPGRYDRASLDATGQRLPIPPPTAPPTRRDSNGRKLARSQKIATQRLTGSPMVPAPLSPIKTVAPPQLAALSPLKVTKRLEDPIA